ncbi:hypothetical protein [Pseudonocardia nigra]|uniref:hypothetical protein n=1 Tax=Pseudonocardia nigra TaxID=1921578 RepID=UPI001C5D60D8|nr:hypothetical protein [Pseudonocardia nigra]
MTHEDAREATVAPDPLARWRDLPERVEPSSWSGAQTTEPVPGSIIQADTERVVRDALQR